MAERDRTVVLHLMLARVGQRIDRALDLRDKKTFMRLWQQRRQIKATIHRLDP